MTSSHKILRQIIEFCLRKKRLKTQIIQRRILSDSLEGILVETKPV